MDLVAPLARQTALASPLQWYQSNKSIRRTHASLNKACPLTTKWLNPMIIITSCSRDHLLHQTEPKALLLNNFQIREVVQCNRSNISREACFSKSCPAFTKSIMVSTMISLAPKTSYLGTTRSSSLFQQVWVALVPLTSSGQPSYKANHLWCITTTVKAHFSRWSSSETTDLLSNSFKQLDSLRINTPEITLKWS